MTDTARQAQRIFKEFIEKDFSHGQYISKIDEMIQKKQSRLIISLDDLREFDSDLAQKFQKLPYDYIPGFEAALEDVVRKRNNDEDYEETVHIGITGNFGKYKISPRQLLSHLLGQLVCVEGIVTKRSISLPKVVRTVHYCPTTNKFHRRDYRDMTTPNGIPTSFAIPTKDENGNPLETEYGLSKYKDTQTLWIQEMPEKAPAGQLPRSVECIVEDDLVSCVKPGDRVRMVGVYRALTGKGTGMSTGIMKTVLLVNNIILLGQQIQHPIISDKEMEKIIELSKRKDVFDLLAKGIAPTIYGHDVIKKALLLLLFGGTEKNLKNGTHIRGDINILMVGDPSTAKSQLLRFMLHIAPLAISTTGRASTGVGLTAAVISDKQTGERTLQAGAMVLADRGIVCVDEFDKMCEIDRVAMHEVMEQQTITIAKAGVHTTLNARASVIAAANPIYGQYNPEISIQRNIGLPDSLLSRFDLVFILLDQHNSKLDRDIASHVLNVHRYRSKQEVSEASDKSMLEYIMLGDEDDNKTNEDIEFEINSNKTFSVSFMRKYIYYAKNRIHPKLTDKAVQLIQQKYCELRKNNSQKTLPITARSLECLIRLATAHAKCRMSKEITEEDVNVVYDIMQYAICFVNNTTEATKRFENIQERKREQRRKRNKRKRSEENSQKESQEEMFLESTSSEENDRKLIIDTLTEEMNKKRVSTMEISQLLECLNKKGKKFTHQELKELLIQLSRSENFIISQESIYAV